MKSLILDATSSMFEAWRGYRRYSGSGSYSQSNPSDSASDKQKKYIGDLLAKMKLEDIKSSSKNEIASLIPEEGADAFWKRVMEIAKDYDPKLLEGISKGNASRLIDALRNSHGLIAALSFLHSEPLDEKIAKEFGNSDYVKSKQDSESKAAKDREEAEQKAAREKEEAEAKSKVVTQRQSKITKLANQYYRSRGGSIDNLHNFRSGGHLASKPENLITDGKKPIKVRDAINQFNDGQGSFDGRSGKSVRVLHVKSNKIYWPAGVLKGEMVVMPPHMTSRYHDKYHASAIGLDPDDEIFIQDDPNPLWDAASNDDTAMVRKLLDEKVYSHADVDEALGKAVSTSSMDVIDLLLNNGARAPMQVALFSSSDSDAEFSEKGRSVFHSTESFWRHAARIGVDKKLLKSIPKNEVEIIDRIRDRFHVQKGGMSDFDIDQESRNSMALKFTRRLISAISRGAVDEFKKTMDEITQDRIHPDFRQFVSGGHKDVDSSIHAVRFLDVSERAILSGNKEIVSYLMKTLSDHNEAWQFANAVKYKNGLLAKINDLGLWQEYAGIDPDYGKELSMATGGAVKLTGPGRKSQDELEYALEDDGKSWKFYFHYANIIAPDGSKHKLGHLDMNNKQKNIDLIKSILSGDKSGS